MVEVEDYEKFRNVEHMYALNVFVRAQKCSLKLSLDSNIRFVSGVLFPNNNHIQNLTHINSPNDFLRCS